MLMREALLKAGLAVGCSAVAIVGLAMVLRPAPEVPASVEAPSTVVGPLAGDGGQPHHFPTVRDAALAGDYQAQRNLAYGYTSAPYPGQERSELLGCAWRIVILHSGSERVDQTDIGNLQVYCGALDPAQLAAAQRQARALFERIYNRSASF